ncbi:MAG: hypothetical protein QXQ60_08115, partial [Thermofilum sp.]
MRQVTEEERKLYQQARAEGLHVYSPEDFYYYYSTPDGHPFAGLTYAEYIEYVRAREAVSTLSRARLQRQCAVDTAYERELFSRAQQISQERGIPYDWALVEAYRQMEKGGFFRTRPGGAVEVRPYVELQTQGGLKTVPVPESVKTDEEFPKWLYEQMKEHGAAGAWVSGQHVAFEQLRQVFEPPPQPEPPKPKAYIEVMRGLGPSEKLEVPTFEEFKKQYPQYGEREYMLYLLKTAAEKGYEKVLTEKGWVKIPSPEDFKITEIEVFTKEGVKSVPLVPLKVFKEAAEASLASTTMGTGSLAVAALKGFGVGVLRGLTFGLSDILVPSMVPKKPLELKDVLPEPPPVRLTHTTAVDFSGKIREPPEVEKALQAYWTHYFASLPGSLVGSWMLGKAVSAVAKLPPVEDIAQRYAAGEKITPLERLKLEAWLHTPEKVWQGLKKVGDVITIKQVKYEIPKEVEAKILRVGDLSQRLTYFSTTVKKWQEVSPELGQLIERSSAPYGFIPVDIGGKTVKVPWVEKGVTALAAGSEKFMLMGTGEKAYGLGLFSSKTLAEPGVAAAKLLGTVNVKTVESLLAGGVPKVAEAVPQLSPAFAAPSIPVKVSTAVGTKLGPLLVPPLPVGGAKVVPEVKPTELLKVPVKTEEEVRETPTLFKLPDIRLPLSVPVVKKEERQAPLSVPFIKSVERVEAAPAVIPHVSSIAVPKEALGVVAVPQVSTVTVSKPQPVERLPPGRLLPPLKPPQIPLPRLPTPSQVMKRAEL